MTFFNITLALFCLVLDKIGVLSKLHYGPGVDLAIQMRTTHTSYGVWPANANGWKPYHFHVPTVYKSGSLNLLEPFGPVQVFWEIV